MITIRTTNAAGVVERQKGWLVARLGGAFVDLHDKVEDVVTAKIRESLTEQGVEAVIEQVPETNRNN